MTAIPIFLQALGLDDDVDERDIRRAYAQRLKLIDPEVDPQDFQTLRGHYEHALQWLMHRSRSQPAPEQAAPEVTPEIQQDITQAAEQSTTPAAKPLSADAQVFASFLERVQAGLHKEEDALRALDEALNDERLISLEARTLFEGRVAALLMYGWQPGHEFLFTPACERFDWQNNSRQLQAYGQLGAAVNAAIQEKLIFFMQPTDIFELQRMLIRLLRNGAPPSSARVLKTEGPMLQVLVQRYPNWLHAIAPRENIARWLKLYNELPLKQREQGANVAQQKLASGRQAPKPARKWQLPRLRFSWYWSWLLIAVFRLIAMNWPSHTDHSPPTADVSAHQNWPAPSTRNPPNPSPDLTSDWPGRSRLPGNGNGNGNGNEPTQATPGSNMDLFKAVPDVGSESIYPAPNSASAPLKRSLKS